MTGRSGRHGGLSLFWKLLLPFAGLVIVVGALGTFLVVRDLASRAQATLDEDLLVASLQARAVVQQHELYLLESATLAANLQGMAERVEVGDEAGIAELLRSVLAVKSELDLLLVTGTDGVGIVEFEQSSDGPQRRPARSWAGTHLVDGVLEGNGTRATGLLRDGDRLLLAIAAPICPAPTACVPGGVVLLGQDIDGILVEATPTGREGTPGGVALFEADQLVASVGTAATTMAAPVQLRELPTRVTGRTGQDQVQTLYDAFVLQGSQRGMIAVTLPTAPVFGAVRAAGWRLAGVLFLVLLGIAGVGGVLTSRILRQVRPLVDTNRALGSGDLSARAPVVTRDEIGEVARGLNAMADQLEASHTALESRVAQRTAEIQRLLDERTEFFASLSHELRTPLAVILGEADLLADTARGEEARSGVLIRQSASNLLGTVNSILDLARSEVGRLEVQPIPLSLADCVEELGPTIEGLGRMADIGLRVEIPADLPPVLADPERLREILLNLIDNACKYTQPGGHVDLTAEARHQEVAIDLSDTGPGIPDGIEDQIFEPFFRVTDTTPRRASSGLGLALTARLVRAHGGTISYVSEEGVGTTFTVTLPRAHE